MGINQLVGLWMVLNFAAVISRATEDAKLDGHEGGRAVHAIKPNKEKPPGVLWVVQLSDLHISKFKPDRAETLQKIMGKVIGTIQPALVLISGDLIVCCALADAKGKGGSSAQQYKQEWMSYLDTMSVISNESGIALNLFYDVRGNHDTFGVPNRAMDYYSRYSIHARQNRTGHVQSVTFLDSSGWKNLFVGVDPSMNIGLRSPSNLFGHPSDRLIAALDRELSQWENDTSEPVTKLVFGHFPTSFTASSESGHHMKEVMVKHSISAYVCGHLHSQFGSQLYRHHETQGLGEFWEWEMGDWRASRMMRVLAIDHGRVSFVDVDFSQSSDDVLNSRQFVMPTIILPTSPLDSRMMLHSSSVQEQVNPGTVRALVFSKAQPASVTATVYDSVALNSAANDYLLVESLEMNLVSGSLTNEKGGQFFYEVLWENQKYKESSSTRYWLQIQVFDNGVTTLSSMWPFSVEGKRGLFSLSLMAFIAFGFEWETLFSVMLWIIITCIFGFLIVPRLVFLHLKKTGVYESWGLSIFNPSADSKFPYIQLPLWALVSGARNGFLWWFQMLYICSLLVLPWLWGEVLGDNYPLGYMFLWGWTVRPSKGSPNQSGLGWPDIMIVVLPYFCEIVVPLVLIVSALCAEQAACEVSDSNVQHPKRMSDKRIYATTSSSGSDPKAKVGSRWPVREDVGGDDVRSLMRHQEGKSDVSDQELMPGLKPVLEKEDKEETREQRPRWRCIRKAYIAACFALVLLHVKRCRSLANSYGTLFLFLSPVYVWYVPVLIASAMFMTASCKPKNSHVN